MHVLTLPFRRPYDAPPMLRFLGAHIAGGTEVVVGNTYARTVQFDGARGWFVAEMREDDVAVTLSDGLVPIADEVARRLRATFDLDMDPSVVARALADDPILAPSFARVPGLRVPGAFDGFELAVRTILGQRISVKAATTLGGRLATKFGGSIRTDVAHLTHLPPTPARLAKADPAALAEVGITVQRAGSIVELARCVQQGTIDLSPAADPESTMTALQEINGIGPWTAHAVAMRGLRWMDAFPDSDLAFIRMLGTRNRKELIARAEVWRPYRAYAALHLWERYVTEPR